MNNLKPLLKQEFLRHIYSYKFVTMSIFAVLVAVLCISVQLMDFYDRKAAYDEELLKAERDKQDIKVFSSIRIPIIIAPNPLSLFSRGCDDTIGNKIVVSLDTVPEYIKTSQKRNYFLDIFRSFDLVTLIQIIFSIMTLFIVADTISGEREEGTLQLIFSSNVRKFEFFSAKFIAALVSLSIPLLLIFIITSLMILWHPYISMNTSHWLGVFVIFLLCAAFISIYILIGMLVSSLTPSASQSVLFGLLVWILLVFIYPNSMNYIVDSLVSIPSSDSINQQTEQLRSEIAKKVNESFRPEDGPSGGSYNGTNLGGFFGLPVRIGLTEKANFEMWEKRVRRCIPTVFDGLERIFRVKQDYYNLLQRQSEIAGTYMYILPGYLLEQSSSKIAGTHYGYRYSTLLGRAKVFRDTIIEYVKSKDGFGLKFFSQIDPKTMEDHFEDYSEEIIDKWRWNNYPVLELPDIPVFTYPEKNFITAESIKELVLLLMMNIVLFVSGSFFFSRMDIRVKK